MLFPHPIEPGHREPRQVLRSATRAVRRGVHVAGDSVLGRALGAGTEPTSHPRIHAAAEVATFLDRVFHWSLSAAGSLRLASSVPDGLANLNSLLGNPTYAGGYPPPPPPPSVDRFHSPQISVFHWSLPTRKLHPHLVPPTGRVLVTATAVATSTSCPRRVAAATAAAVPGGPCMGRQAGRAA